MFKCLLTAVVDLACITCIFRPFDLMEVSVAALGGSTTEHTFFCGYQPGWVRCFSPVSVELQAEMNADR